MGYLSKYDMNEEYAPSTFSPETQSNAAGGGEAGTAGAGAAGAMSGNPYLMGAGIAGSFLTSYLNRKQQQFEAQKQAAMNVARNYQGDQSQALGQQMQNLRSALL